MLPDWLPWLLQVNDTQFPSGAYAHSMGLEDLVQREVVCSPEDLERFLREQIVPGLRAFDLPMLAAAHRCASKGDVSRLRALDEELEAWKLAAELRQASRQIGSRRLALVRKLDPDPLISAYVETGAPCHHLVSCALELRRLPVDAAACAFALQTISGYATASMKLMRLGQERCQTIVRAVISSVARHIADATAVPADRAGWFNPLLEIASMRHARARERLFIS